MDAEAASVYFLSKENVLKRPRDQLLSVARAEAHFIRQLLPPLEAAHGFAIRIVGSPRYVPEPLAQAIAQTTAQQAGSGSGRTLNLLVNYDPFDELRSTMAREMSQLWVGAPVDLVIRTVDAA